MGRRPAWLEAWTRAGVPEALTSIATFMTPPPEFELGDEPVLLLGWVWASSSNMVLYGSAFDYEYVLLPCGGVEAVWCISAIPMKRSHASTTGAAN